jgi:iron complex transport system ATP-binding protein
MPDCRSVVELDNVSLTRGENTVFSSFSWQVRSGEHWFVMGNNGCGKTSLMEIIMAYVWPQSGSVRVLDELYGNTFIQDVRRRIGYVSPWIFRRTDVDTPVCNVVASGIDGSVRYVGALPANLLARVAAKLEFFGCEELVNRPFGQLSSGQQFKVILSRALINDPELLLLDEPFAQLDIGARMRAYDLVEQLIGRTSAPAVILVTHHLEDITASYTHGLLFKDSSTRFAASRERILTNEMFSDVFGIRRILF